MFRRRHRQDHHALPTEPPSHTVRVLRDEDELKAALERARAYERRGMAEYERRLGSYDRALDPHAGLAEVHPIEGERAVS